MEGTKEFSQNLASEKGLELFDTVIELNDEELDMVQGGAQGLQGAPDLSGATSGDGIPVLNTLLQQISKGGA